TWVPGRHDLPARISVLADQLDQVRDLVDTPAISCFPVTPLLPIDWSQIAVLIRPLVPDADVAILQPVDVGVASDEPENFDNDRAQVQLLGRQQRETLGEIEPHLRPEPRQRPRTGPVFLL